MQNHPKLLQNPDYEDKSNTSLHLAALNGLTDIAHFLVKAGHEQVEVSRNADHDTPLMLAARSGHVEVGRYLIQEFAICIPYQNRVGLDALALASQNILSTGLLGLLLSDAHCPASPQVRDGEGNTALHHASASGSLKALRILLAAGANPLAKNDYDWTPLAYSQTVAAEVYFKNLVAEFERRKVEGAKMGEERDRQRAAGVRIVDERGLPARTRRSEEDEASGEVLKRHWSPTAERLTPTSSIPKHEWGLGLLHIRTSSSSAG